LTELGRAVAEGKLAIPIAKKLPLAQARDPERGRSHVHAAAIAPRER
jgi:hypothetical protein